MKKHLVVFALCVVISLVQSSPGSILAIWDFGDSSSYYTEVPANYNTVTVPTLTLAGSDIDTNGKNGVAYVDSEGNSHIDGQAAAWDDINKSGSENDAALFITLDTTGFTNLVIRWDYKSEEAVSFDLAYRTSADGSWTQVADNQAITPGWDTDTWYSVVLDLSAFSDLNNQSYLQFRLDDLVEGPGNNKFAIDNIEITGVPEPATLLLMGLGAAVMGRRKQD